MKITRILARELLDSRGNPTLEAELTLDDQFTARAIVPSGASTGEHEAVELRDNDKNRYLGKGVLDAVNNVNTVISNHLIKREIDSQKSLDDILIELLWHFRELMHCVSRFHCTNPLALILNVFCRPQ
jgi:enolase